MLSTISERGTSSPVRISSPRRIPISKRSFTSSSYTPRPININTADIDVSRDRYRNKPESPAPAPPERDAVDQGEENGPFMPRVDGKPETGIDSSPGVQRSTIRRGRTVVRLHTIKRKEKDSPRTAQAESSEIQQDDVPTDEKIPVNEESMPQDESTELVGWREKLSDDLTYKDKREKKTLGAKLVEKFIVKDKDSDSDNSIKEKKKKKDIPESLPPQSPVIKDTGCSSDRRCSIEMLAEQANLLDSLIRGENLSTATLDLSKVGITNESDSMQQPIKRRKSNKENPLQTTKSDQSLHNSMKSLEDPKHFSKRRSLKKSLSGGSICRLDSITEFPKEAMLADLPVIEESRVSVKRDSIKLRSKPKPKITGSVEVSEPKSPLKFVVENITVEEKSCVPKKELKICAVEEPPQTKSTKNENIVSTPRKSNLPYNVKKRTKVLVNEEDDAPSPEPDDGNFWDKIGKRETVYLMKRKQNLEESKERNRRALYWFPEEESGPNNEELTNLSENNVTNGTPLDNKYIKDSYPSENNNSIDNNKAIHSKSVEEMQVAEKNIINDNELQSDNSEYEEAIENKTSIVIKDAENHPKTEATTDDEKSVISMIKLTEVKEPSMDSRKSPENTKVLINSVNIEPQLPHTFLNKSRNSDDTANKDIKEEKTRTETFTKYNLETDQLLSKPNKSGSDKSKNKDKLQNKIKLDEKVLETKITKDEGKKDETNKISENTDTKNINMKLSSPKSSKNLTTEKLKVPEKKPSTDESCEKNNMTTNTNAISNINTNLPNTTSESNISTEKKPSVEMKISKVDDKKINQAQSSKTNENKPSNKMSSSLEAKVTDKINSESKAPDTSQVPNNSDKKKEILPDSTCKNCGKEVDTGAKKIVPNGKDVLYKKPYESKIDQIYKSVEKRTQEKIVKENEEFKKGNVSKIPNIASNNATKDVNIATVFTGESSQTKKDKSVQKDTKFKVAESIPIDLSHKLNLKSETVSENNKQATTSCEQETDATDLGTTSSKEPTVTEPENIPNKENEPSVQDEKTGEDKKAENKEVETKTEQLSSPKEEWKTPASPRKPVKDEPASRPLIATPRPLQKKQPQVIHSSSSSETSSDEESSDDEDADESDASEDSTEFYECENNTDGRTSTGSNDSGFDSSAPTSPAGFVHVKKGKP